MPARVMMLDEPLHEHDCECCTYLGTMDKHDLYVCPSEPTVIARYGPDGDYKSGLAFVNHSELLRVAADLALERGLLTQAQIDLYTSRR